MSSSTRGPLLVVAAATAVLVVGGAGGAVAGAMITGKQIKDNTVTTKDIKNASLTGQDVKNSSFTGADVKNGSLGLGDLSTSARGSFGSPVISGRVTSGGSLDVASAPPGFTVTVSRPSAGSFCLKALGSAGPIDSTRAVLVATADYAASTTSISSDNEAIVESSPGSGVLGCEGGFVIFTMNRAPGGDVSLISSSFNFMLH